MKHFVFHALLLLCSRLVKCLSEDDLKKLSPSDSGQTKGESFGAHLKVNPPVYIDYSLVELPVRSAQRQRSIDISYQPPPVVECKGL